MIRISVQPTYSFIEQIVVVVVVVLPFAALHPSALNFRLKSFLSRSFKKAPRVPLPSQSILQPAIFRSNGLTSFTSKCLPAWAKEHGLWSQLARVNIK